MEHLRALFVEQWTKGRTATNDYIVFFLAIVVDSFLDNMRSVMLSVKVPDASTPKALLMRRVIYLLFLKVLVNWLTVFSL